MASNSELLKQYKTLVRTIESFSDGQASIGQSPNGEEDEDTLTILYINISPNDGPYNGGTFLFKLDLSDGYPNDPPKINCLTKVYHPNIDQIDEYSEGDICLNLMDELWTPDLTLEDFVQGLLFMFYNPNIEDPLNPAFHGGESEDEFQENVLRSMRGEEVDGIEYENVLKKSDDKKEGEEITMPTLMSIVTEGGVNEGKEDEIKTEIVTIVTNKLEESINRDDATGQCEEQQNEHTTKDHTHLVPHPSTPDHTHLTNYGFWTLLVVGVGVWAGLQLSRRFPVR